VAAFRPEHKLEPVDVLFIEVADSCLEIEVPQPDSTEAESELLSLKIVCIFSLHYNDYKSVEATILYCTVLHAYSQQEIMREEFECALLCDKFGSSLQLRPVQ
jgi:hypothetical protein